MSFLTPYNEQIQKICRQYNVKQMFAFGSVLTSAFSEQSDVDLIVSFNQMPIENYADNYFDLKFTLQDILNRPVDLLEEQAIKNPYFLQNVNHSKQLIYG